LVKLCLTIDKIPNVQLENIDKYIEADLKETEPIIFKEISGLSKSVTDGQAYNSTDISEVMKINPSDLFTGRKTAGAAEPISEATKAA